MSALLFISPMSGREISTGIEIDPVSFHQGLPPVLADIKCPDCGLIHNCSTWERGSLMRPREKALNVLRRERLIATSRNACSMPRQALRLAAILPALLMGGSSGCTSVP